VDCDADTLLLKVDPAGPACHTGERSCFYRRSVAPAAAPAVVGVEAPAAAQVSATLEDGRAMSTRDILEELFDVILDRQAHPEPGSYTVHLLESGEDEVLKKVGEEAMEVILAGKGQSDERLIAEVADLFYHLLVLFAARGVTLDDVKTELERRRK
jgi:phosphoribosyl-ATP pyrophosphohydrolase/phosphoribosyl-AMP cyclohydrolase